MTNLPQDLCVSEMPLVLEWAPFLSAESCSPEGNRDKSPKGRLGLLRARVWWVDGARPVHTEAECAAVAARFLPMRTEPALLPRTFLCLCMVSVSGMLQLCD